MVWYFWAVAGICLFFSGYFVGTIHASWAVKNWMEAYMKIIDRENDDYE